MVLSYNFRIALVILSEATIAIFHFEICNGFPLKYFSSPEPKALKVSLYDGTRGSNRTSVSLSVRPSVRPYFPICISRRRAYPSQSNFKRSILPALGFNTGKIGTLVSVATASSHIVINKTFLSTL